MARLQRRDPNEVLLDTLKQAIAEGVLKELVLEVAAPIKMSAKRPDGSYRTVSVSANDEFIPSGARMHAKGEKVIFEFKPVDPNGDYTQFELDDTKVFTAFPDVESLVVRALGHDAVDTDDNPIRFAMIKHKFLKNAEVLEEQRIEEEKKAEEATTKNHYAEHPLFGVWG
jgi:hypothetical protein